MLVRQNLEKLQVPPHTIHSGNALDRHTFAPKGDATCCRFGPILRMIHTRPFSCGIAGPRMVEHYEGSQAYFRGWFRTSGHIKLVEPRNLSKLGFGLEIDGHKILFWKCYLFQCDINVMSLHGLPTNSLFLLLPLMLLSILQYRTCARTGWASFIHRRVPMARPPHVNIHGQPRHYIHGQQSRDQQGVETR